MNRKDMMMNFINAVINKKLFTKFINTIFGYDILNDYNYIFRVNNNVNEIIIEIYDNVSDIRFNKYIFNFNNDIINDYKDGYVVVKCINVTNCLDDSDILLKFAYLFNLDKKMMINYASSFMDYELVNILTNIIK